MYDGLPDILCCGVSGPPYTNVWCIAGADVFLRSSPEEAMKSPDYKPVPTLVGQNSVEGMIVLIPDIITEGMSSGIPRESQKTDVQARHKYAVFTRIFVTTSAQSSKSFVAF